MIINLSPYEKNRIIPNSFGQTEMGRDLLAQDYILKQISSSLMNPQEELGAEFWDRVHEKVQARLGNVDMPINTFNKIWIVPERASVYEHAKGAFLVDTHLKVMLEEDYLALEANQNSTQHGLGDIHSTELTAVTGASSQAIRDILLPEIEREVNEGKTFANLRQIFNSVVLASWFKTALKESLLGQIYVDQKKIVGVESGNPGINQEIYNQYLEAFQKGVFDFVREDYDASRQTVISRKYFSGGADIDPRETLAVFGQGKLGMNDRASQAKTAEVDRAMAQANPRAVTVDLQSRGMGRTPSNSGWDANELAAKRQQLRELEAEFTEQSRQKSIEDDFGLGAQVIYVDGDVLGRDSGYYFQTDDGEWIIVLNASLDNASQEQAQFHEAAEIYLIEQGYQFTEPQRHAIASALQRQKFFDGTNLILQDRKMMGYYRQLEGSVLIKEAHKLQAMARESRHLHHGLFVVAEWMGISFNGVTFNRDQVGNYENLFREAVVEAAVSADKKLIRRRLIPLNVERRSLEENIEDGTGYSVYMDLVRRHKDDLAHKLRSINSDIERIEIIRNSHVDRKNLHAQAHIDRVDTSKNFEIIHAESERDSEIRKAINSYDAQVRAADRDNDAEAKVTAKNDYNTALSEINRAFESKISDLKDQIKVEKQRLEAERDREIGEINMTAQAEIDVLTNEVRDYEATLLATRHARLQGLRDGWRAELQQVIEEIRKLEDKMASEEVAIRKSAQRGLQASNLRSGYLLDADADADLISIDSYIIENIAPDAWLAHLARMAAVDSDDQTQWQQRLALAQKVYQRVKADPKNEKLFLGPDDNRGLDRVFGVRPSELGNSKDSEVVDSQGNPLGGIDLNRNIFELDIEKQGTGFKFTAPEQFFENITVEGFEPVIINVFPVPNLPVFLGQAQEVPDEMNLSLL